ncbi:MAG: ATP-binding protein [Bacteroidales bacterium]|nr:ATP-binding protein [Bacteroidales bacterium]MCM1148436.1 ATP-binding protein [Bacteroidales bacterium]MCM1206678.1 ATP-binding protein [Bacillota bacterium]MCM1510581.1 ATP-binding protein [Clostridium sp.]
MYFKRHIDRYLQEWKETPRRKPLLLRGARQVGKSRTLRHLGESFDYFIEINFETRREFKRIFQETSDVHDIVSRIGILTSTPVVEDRTLIFLDEIHACPEALHSLWAFKENMPRLHVAAAGSLLEFTLKEMPAFGVGRIRSMFMYPMSFDEFLSASGHDGWVEVKKQAGYSRPLPSELHNALLQQFRSFLIVGGMPASVGAWVETHDYLQCAEEQEDILQTYYDDFAKYSRKIDPLLLRNTLRSVVVQTGRKFVYSNVEGGYRTDDIKRALTMLCDAGIVKLVQHSAGNGLPLGAESNPKFRKYNYLDSGLLLRILDIEMGSAVPLTELILAGTAEELVNKGSLAEMVAGWEMIKSMTPRISHDLYYWENLSEGTTSEVDYLITQDMKIVPIEIKAGTTGKMKSLRLFMRRKHLDYAKRCSLENFGIIEFSDADDENRLTTKHIYMHPLHCMSTIVK